LKADGEALVNKVKGVFAFKVKDVNGNEGVWLVDAKNGKGSVQFGGTGENFVGASVGNSHYICMYLHM
jgi:sterol carrier protein 2